ncbi:MAG: glycogen synthase GlgA [Bacilli bacterium]|nr:glycogen synthase GlgA [Bacilli bacterium]
MHILFVASEAVPFAKTGGLADVVGELPKYLVKQGAEVSVILPLYRRIKEKYISELSFVSYYFDEMDGKRVYAGLFEYVKDNVKYYFVDNDDYFGRDNLYGYDDDCWRFAFFMKTVVYTIKSKFLNVDVMHLHDWHTAMLAPYIKYNYYSDGQLNHIKTVLTIHNPMYQGLCDKYYLSKLFYIPMGEWDNGLNRFKDCLSYLKSGIVFADKITTVSPTHRNELLTSEYAYGLEGILNLRQDDFIGIVNGIDYSTWNPKTDKHIVSNYSLYGVNKLKNKEELQRRFNIEVNRDLPLFGLVSRFTWQKGIDLLTPIIDQLMERNVELVILGSGDKNYESAFEFFRQKYPNRIGIYIGYNDELAHQIYAGSDMFLMPSYFEPCGISQMMAMRYGSLPIVHEVGGLKDTVVPYNEYTMEGTGFSFKEANPYVFLHTIDYALNFFYNKDVWRKIVNQAMKANFSWDKSAEQYIKLYQDLCR